MFNSQSMNRAIRARISEEFEFSDLAFEMTLLKNDINRDLAVEQLVTSHGFFKVRSIAESLCNGQLKDVVCDDKTWILAELHSLYPIEQFPEKWV